MNAPTKKDYEVAIDNYVAAEAEYKKLEEFLLSGEAAVDVMQRANGDADFVRREWNTLVEQLKRKLEELNALFFTARNAFRQAVALAPSQQRGPGGKASTMSYGPFTVESATRRWLDPKDLLRAASRHGKLPELLSLTGFNKDGKEYRLVEQSWKIDYPNVLKWLQSQGLQNVIDAAYDEIEDTPRVKGVKPLAFLGEKIEK